MERIKREREEKRTIKHVVKFYNYERREVSERKGRVASEGGRFFIEF